MLLRANNDDLSTDNNGVINNHSSFTENINKFSGEHFLNLNDTKEPFQDNISLGAQPYWFHNNTFKEYDVPNLKTVNITDNIEENFEPSLFNQDNINSKSNRSIRAVQFNTELEKEGSSDNTLRDSFKSLFHTLRKWNSTLEDHPKDLKTAFKEYKLYTPVLTNEQKYFGNNAYTIINDTNTHNIHIKIYAKNLRASKLTKIKKDIKNVFEQFEGQVTLETTDTIKYIEYFIFDEQSDYKHYGKDFITPLGNEGGLTVYIGQNNTIAKVYVYQRGSVHNLKHETAHALVGYIINGNNIPTVISEGIAETIQNIRDTNALRASVDIVMQENKLLPDLQYDSLLSLTYSDNYVLNSLPYKVGHALVSYFNDKSPKILEDYLYKVQKGEIDQSLDLLRQEYNQTEFQNWLSQHSTKVSMKQLNALKVERGERLWTVDERQSDGLGFYEYKNITYYSVNIKTLDGQKVGHFPVIRHAGYQNLANLIQVVTNTDAIYLNSTYHFIKGIRNTDNTIHLTFCDRDGNEFSNSADYISWLNTNKHYIQTIKTITNTDSNKLIDTLLYFDFASIVDIQSKHFSDYFAEDKVFELKALNIQKNVHMRGVSIFLNQEKIAELSLAQAVIKVIDGNNWGNFIYGEGKLYYNIDERNAYVAVQKQSNQYKMSFIKGYQGRDKYFAFPYLAKNPFFELNINSIDKNKLNSKILIKGAKILDYADSAFIKQLQQQEHGGLTIKRGPLINSMGTEQKLDDIYQASLMHNNSVIYEFQSKGFSIIEPNDILVQQDYAQNTILHYPAAIKYLKLIKFMHNGQTIIKLSPSTVDGNECPDNMDHQILQDYRFVDPIYAIKYQKEDHSHEHITVGLINFDHYDDGTLFRVKHAPNDYQIYKDRQGNILRKYDEKYITKVKIYDPNGKEIGMLSNDFYHFKEKIFFSVDFNYSYKDFLASYLPHVKNITLKDGTKAIMFTQGEGDLTDNGYYDFKRIPIKEAMHQDVVTILQNRQDNCTHDLPPYVNALTASQDSPDYEDASSYSSAWLGGVALIGGIIMALYKKKQQANENNDNNIPDIELQDITNNKEHIQIQGEYTASVQSNPHAEYCSLLIAEGTDIDDNYA